jgi:MFS family permease
MTATARVTDQRALRRWRNAIIVAFGLGGLTLAAWGPRLPDIRAELGVDTGTIGVILVGVTLGSVTGLLLSTPLLRWLGSRRSIRAVILLIAAALAVVGVAATLGSVVLIVIAFVIAGLGIGALDVMINVDGVAVETAAGKTLLPLMHAAWSGGAAVGSGIGAACAALGIDPGWQFIGEAVLIAMIGLAIAPSIPAGIRADVPREQQSLGTRFLAWLRGWADWRLLTIGLVMLGAELGEGTANNWLTLATKDGHGQPEAIAALFFTVFALTEAATRALAGPVIDRIGRVATVRITTALGVLGAILFILGTTWWIALLGVLLWAIGVSMGFPLGMSAAAESGPNPAARVSVVATLGYAANFAGPPAIGIIAEHAGVLSALWLVAALLAAAFAASGALGTRSRPAAE